MKLCCWRKRITGLCCTVTVVDTVQELCWCCPEQSDVQHVALLIEVCVLRPEALCYY